MKILVAIKRVIDYNIKVRIKADHSDVDLHHTKMSINPFCEIALEEAVRLKEAGIAKEVIAVSIGDKETEEQIRYALALGADRGLRIAAQAPLSSLYVAQLLSGLVKREQPGLILLGKQAIDSDNNQTGQMLAALAGLAQGTFASHISVADQEVHVTREVDGGLQTLALTLPAVITADLRLNTPRYAKLPHIMQAKKKPLDIIDANTLAPAPPSFVTQTQVTPPTTRQGGVKVDTVATLIDKLKNEAKVI